MARPGGLVPPAPCQKQLSASLVLDDKLFDNPLNTLKLKPSQSNWRAIAVVALVFNSFNIVRYILGARGTSWCVKRVRRSNSRSPGLLRRLAKLVHEALDGIKPFATPRLDILVPRRPGQAPDRVSFKTDVKLRFPRPQQVGENPTAAAREAFRAVEAAYDLQIKQEHKDHAKLLQRLFPTDSEVGF